MSSALNPLGEAGAPRSARAVMEALGLGAAGPDGRVRVVAAMIASIDGRAAVDGRSVGLGHRADRALLRELRSAVDAILVGAPTMAAEGYANLLDTDQRDRRAARGLAPVPIVATISRRLDVPIEVGLFSEPDARIVVYTESPGELRARGATVTVHRFAPGGTDPAAVLAHLHDEHAVRSVLCEGGPTLLHGLIAAGWVDDLMLTLSPLLVGGDGPRVLIGAALHPPRRLELRDVHRADDHLVLRYGAR